MSGFRRRELLVGAGGGLLPLGLGASRAGDGAPPRRVRIGQIGVGHAHASKLSVYRASPDYDLIGVVEPDPALRARAEREPAFQGVRWMSREQLLETPGLEAVLVETRVRDALETAEACVAAGKHIHLDKPAGASLPRYRRLLEAAEGRKLLVQMGYMYRYNPAILMLRSALARGWLGAPFEVHAVMSKVVEPGERVRLAEFSGGILFELGCHIIDLVVGILGKPGSVAPFNQHVGPADDGLVDNGLAVLTYPKALATVKSSAVEVDGGARRHLVVCGTEGTMHIQPLDDPRARVTFAKPHDGSPRGARDVSFPKFTRYVADAADMARILRGEKPSDFPYAHDLAVQETVLRSSGMSIE